MPLLGTFGGASVNGFSQISKIGYPVGQILFTSSGTWTVPTGVTKITVLAIGGGAGFRSIDTPRGCSGAVTGWVNNLTVTPGQAVTVVVGDGGGLGGPAAGGMSYIQFGGVTWCQVPGGALYSTSGTLIASGGTYDLGVLGGASGTTGQGYSGGTGRANSTAGAGGGAGGYYASGASGVLTNISRGNTGGGGTGGYLAAGGGVDVFGLPASYSASFVPTFGNGNGFQGSTKGTSNWDGTVTRNYGGGGGGTPSGGSTQGGNGAVRIIWGPGRAYPGTLTLDQTEVAW